jgi:hypothetical protein
MRSGNGFFIGDFPTESRLSERGQNGEPGHCHGQDDAHDEQQARAHTQDIDGFDQAAVLLGQPGNKLGSRSQFLAQLPDLRFERALPGFRRLPGEGGASCFLTAAQSFCAPFTTVGAAAIRSAQGMTLNAVIQPAISDVLCLLPSALLQ